jgi:hypothetical protein
MQTHGIKALKTNTSALSNAFDGHDTLPIARRGEPIGLAAPFDECLLDLGFTRWMARRAFQAGDLGLGQLAKAFDKSKQEMLPLLAHLGVEVADYDLDEDLETIRVLDGAWMSAVVSDTASLYPPGRTRSTGPVGRLLRVGSAFRCRLCRMARRRSEPGPQGRSRIVLHP